MGCCRTMSETPCRSHGLDVQRTRVRAYMHARARAMQVKASDAEAELRQAKAEATAMQLDSDLASARVRAQQLEAAAKARDKDVERLQRAIDQCKASEVSERPGAVPCCWRVADGARMGLPAWLLFLYPDLSTSRLLVRGSIGKVIRCTKRACRATKCVCLLVHAG